MRRNFLSRIRRMIKKQKNNWLKITFFLPILRAHTITLSLRYANALHYRNCESVYIQVANAAKYWEKLQKREDWRETSFLITPCPYIFGLNVLTIMDGINLKFLEQTLRKTLKFKQFKLPNSFN